MKPKSIHTIIIGRSVPDIVLRCVSNNAKLCEAAGLKYIIHNPIRDYSYICPGLQAEYEKLRILSKYKRSIVCDWDIYFRDVDFQLDDSLYFGESSRGRSDMFLTYNGAGRSFFKLCLDCANTIRQDPAFTFKMSNGVSHKKFPSRHYIHLETRCGLSNIRSDWMSLPEFAREAIEEKCSKLLNYHLSMGDENVGFQAENRQGDVVAGSCSDVGAGFRVRH